MCCASIPRKRAHWRRLLFCERLSSHALGPPLLAGARRCPPSCRCAPDRGLTVNHWCVRVRVSGENVWVVRVPGPPWSSIVNPNQETNGGLSPARKRGGQRTSDSEGPLGAERMRGWTLAKHIHPAQPLRARSARMDRGGLPREKRGRTPPREAPPDHDIAYDRRHLHAKTTGSSGRDQVNENNTPLECPTPRQPRVIS